MPTLNPYDREFLRRQKAIINRILQHYQDAIQFITPSLSTIKYKGKLFRLSDYPVLNARVEKALNSLQSQIYVATVNGVRDSWDLSNKKNDVLVDKRLVDKKLVKPKVRQALYDPNKSALTQYINRKEKGMNLSGRIWNTLEPFKAELEQGLGIGIGKGQSAQELAKDLRKNLLDPDRLFRRVRGEDGKLYLSAPARNYNPGQGVYRSSFKNALRLTRTETNMAYRTADHERWKKMPFVKGIRVQLSNAHPRYDICDKLVGLYPKDFKFPGWHPQCLCFATPELMDEAEYDQLEDAILAGEPLPASKSAITKPPPAFGQYLKDNKEMLARLKNEPYWIRDNKQYVEMSKEKLEELMAGKNRIGSQFTKIDKSIRESVNHGLSAIDNVHGDGILDDIPIKYSSAKSFNAQFGTIGRSAYQIKVSTYAKNPEVSFVHEMGHYLDFYSIKEKGRFASMAEDAAVKGVLDAANETAAIKRMRKTLDDGFSMIDDKKMALSAMAKSHLRYLLDPREIFARSYAQYISKRSGSEILAKGIENVVEADTGKIYAHQWVDADFEKILDAMDEMMLELGWRVNQ